MIGAHGARLGRGRRPDFFPPGTICGADFCNDVGLLNGINVPLDSLASVVRNCNGVHDWANGVWSDFPSNIKRRTNKGWRLEPVGLNKCENFNANPTDLTGVTNATNAPITAGYVSVADDATRINADGYGNICTTGKAIRFFIPAAVASGAYRVLVQGDNGSTNAFTASVVARKVSGGANNIEISLSSHAADTALGPNSETYQRYTKTIEFPADASRRLLIGVDHVTGTDSEYFFILNQLEEGNRTSSPIVVAGTSRTRAADIGTANTFATVLSGMSEGIFGCEIDYDISVPAQDDNYQRVVTCDDGSSNERVTWLVNAGLMRSSVKSGGLTSSVTHGALQARNRLVFGLVAGGLLHSSMNGAAGQTQPIRHADFTLLNKLRIGRNSAGVMDNPFTVRKLYLIDATPTAELVQELSSL